MSLFEFFNPKPKPAKAAQATLPHPVQPWLVSDVLALRTFLRSQTGSNLLNRARAMEYHCAVVNARDVFHTQHSAGVTAGLADAFNWLEQLASDEMLQKLSVPTADQPENSNTTSDEQDDAALVEKYSP